MTGSEHDSKRLELTSAELRENAEKIEETMRKYAYSGSPESDRFLQKKLDEIVKRQCKKGERTVKVYTKDHTWMVLDTAIGNDVIVGITEYGGSELGQIVYADLPEVGKEIRKGETLCTLESTKTVHEVPCPVDGRITKVASPDEADGLFYELINSNPESVAICYIDAQGDTGPFDEGYLQPLEYTEYVEKLKKGR